MRPAGSEGVGWAVVFMDRNLDLVHESVNGGSAASSASCIRGLLAGGGGLGANHGQMHGG